MFIINSHVSVIFFSKNYRAKPGRSASTYIKESLNILKFLRNKTLKSLQLEHNGSPQIHMTVYAKKAFFKLKPSLCSYIILYLLYIYIYLYLFIFIV